MNYIGIEIHKRYSICATQDEQDRHEDASSSQNGAPGI